MELHIWLLPSSTSTVFLICVKVSEIFYTSSTPNWANSSGLNSVSSHTESLHLLQSEIQSRSTLAKKTSSSLQPSWATENLNKQRAFTTEILCLSFKVVQHFQTMPKGINSTQWVIYLKRTQQVFLALPKYTILHKRMLFTAPRCEEQSLYTKVCQSAITCCQYGQMAKRIDWALE